MYLTKNENKIIEIKFKNKNNYKKTINTFFPSD